MGRRSKILYLLVTSVLIAVWLGLGKVYAQSEADIRNVTSTITVSPIAAIGLSSNLSDGINFGILDPDTENNNATDNYNDPGGNTSMWVYADPNNSMDIDICIMANASLTSGGGDVIENYNNYTWSDSEYNNVTLPPTYGWNITTYYNKTTYRQIGPGERDYFRFWLDVPEAQPAGTYTNMVSFKAVPSGEDC
jgi:hypothetical protein